MPRKRSRDRVKIKNQPLLKSQEVEEVTLPAKVEPEAEPTPETIETETNGELINNLNGATIESGAVVTTDAEKIEPIQLEIASKEIEEIEEDSPEVQSPETTSVKDEEILVVQAQELLDLDNQPDFPNSPHTESSLEETATPLEPATLETATNSPIPETVNELATTLPTSGTKIETIAASETSGETLEIIGETVGAAEIETEEVAPETAEPQTANTLEEKVEEAEPEPHVRENLRQFPSKAVSGEPSVTKKKRRGLSLALYPLSLGGSNAERLEIEAMFAPPYNAAKYGLSLTASPFQADLILLYGSLTEKMAPIAYRLLSSLPPDVKLVALGSETLSASPFRNAYAVIGPFLDEADETKNPNDQLPHKQGIALPPGLHLDGYISGSPPDPQSLLDGILELVLTQS